MQIVKVSIKRQITLFMMYLIIIGFGMFSLTQLKIDLFPDIEFPVVGIITNYQGVGPADIENLVSRPLEEAVTAVKNVEKVSSQSSVGSSILMLEFEYGTDMDQAEIDVRNRIDLVRDFLPADANSPLIFAFDPSMTPILFLTVSSPYLGPAELRRISEDTIEPLLERVEGVASAQTQGGLKRQINISLNPVLMASYSLAPEDVARTIQMGSGLLPSGTVKTTSKNYNLRVFSEYNSLDQIKNTIVTYKNGQPVYVKDVADVEDGFRELTADVRANYGQGIVIPISKQSDANTVATSERVVAALSDIENRLPQDTKFSVVWDQADFISKSVNNLRDTALIAFVFAFLVIYLFLRNWRGSIIMGISIPVSIVATFAVLMLADLTLNIITMAGLALAIGMLVDNSIVVLENIYRHREMGKSKSEAAYSGTTEVGMAIIASTLTTVSVFLPVLFVPNITGELFRDMVLTITFSLMVSLVVALTLVPMLSSRFLLTNEEDKKLRFKKLKSSLGNGFDWLDKKYSGTLNWSVNHKKSVLGIVTILLVSSLFLTTFLGGEFLPKTDQGIIQVFFEAPEGSPLNTTRKVVYNIEEIIREEVPELQSLYLGFGAQEGFASFDTKSNTIEMIAKLTPKNERNRSSFEIQDELRERFDNIPGVTYRIQQGGFVSNERDIEVKIIGYDIDQAKAIAKEIQSKMEDIEGLVDIELNMKATSPELQIRMNKDVVNDYKLSTMQVAANISTAMQGKTTAQYREGGDEYDVYVRLDPEFRKSKEAVEQLLMPLPSGDMVPLSSLASVTEAESTPTIYRENQSRYVSIGAGLSGTDLSTAVSEIESILDETPIPSDYQVIIGGTAEDQQESFFYLTIAFLAAILLVYMIMAAQFESLVDPLIIMFTVPLSVIGVFIFLFITGTSLSVMALVGLVMLVGIAVNNGIVLVDYINQLRDRGISLYEAVKKGSEARLRPVLMTALTTILGMVPLAIELGSGSETWSPLARAVIGGLITTTLLTLLVIPILYILFERMEERIKEFFAKRRAKSLEVETM